jgi:hypothetical protein
MDPNETLRLIRTSIKEMEEAESQRVWRAHAEELAEYVTALDEWLCSGGFPPGDWIKVVRKPA